MNAVIDALIEKVRKDPMPEGHTSSYWKDYTQRVSVDQKADTLKLDSSAFETIHRFGIPGRVLHCLERASYIFYTSRLKNYPTVWKNAVRLTHDLSGDPNFNVFKAAAIVSVLSDHWQEQQLSPKTFAIIGDGFGFLGALLRRTVPGMHLYSIDLPKSLVFQARTHLTADPQARLALLSHQRVGETPAQVTLVAAPDAEKIPDNIDCAINVASMQEMNAYSIRFYFDLLRKRSTEQSRFYCVNRTEKVLPGGEIARFSEFPWSPKDQIFFDGICPYYRHYFASQTELLGPRVLGARVPFVNYFDGEHRHRLVHLSSQP